MATKQLVPKSELFNHLYSVFNQRETGTITIRTDTSRSIILRIFEGKLTHSNGRTSEISEAIEVLRNCNQVKFSHIRAKGSDGPELITAEHFMQKISPGGRSVSSSAEKITASGNNQAITDNAKEVLIKLADEYIGTITTLIVEEAIEEANDLESVIEMIVDAIPDAEGGNTFRIDAIDQLTDEITS